MTQTGPAARRLEHARPRRGLGVLVGVVAMLTPLAVAPAVPAARHVARSNSSTSAKVFAKVLGDGGGRGYGRVDGVGSLGSRVTDVASDIGDDSPGPGRATSRRSR